MNHPIENVTTTQGEELFTVKLETTFTNPNSLEALHRAITDDEQLYRNQCVLRSGVDPDSATWREDLLTYMKAMPKAFIDMPVLYNVDDTAITRLEVTYNAATNKVEPIMYVRADINPKTDKSVREAVNADIRNVLITLFYLMQELKLQSEDIVAIQDDPTECTCGQCNVGKTKGMIDGRIVGARPLYAVDTAMVLTQSTATFDPIIEKNFSTYQKAALSHTKIDPSSPTWQEELLTEVKIAAMENQILLMEPISYMEDDLVTAHLLIPYDMITGKLKPLLLVQKAIESLPEADREGRTNTDITAAMSTIYFLTKQLNLKTEDLSVAMEYMSAPGRVTLNSSTPSVTLN